MINKEILCKIFCKNIQIKDNHLVLNRKSIKNKLVKNIVKEYKKNATEKGMASPYSYGILQEGFKNRGLCDKEQLFALYALSEILKSDYLALLYFDIGNYIYFFNAVDTESLETEIILWNNKFNVDDFYITEYGSVLIEN